MNNKKGENGDKKDSRLSRRDFLKGSVALATTASGLLSMPRGNMLANSNSMKQTITGALTPPTTIHPVHGGDVRAATQVSGNVCDYLVRYFPNKGLEPNLAKSWDRSEDAETWMFQLREGVKFHHGTEFTAETVKWNFTYWLDPDTAAGFAPLFEHVESVNKKGKYEVEIKLKRPDPDFIYALLDYHCVMMPHDRDPEEWTQDPVGTGPFLLEDYVTGDHALLKRNPNYWLTSEGESLPYLDELRFTFIPEKTTQIATLQGGTADVLPEVPLTEATRVGNIPSIKLATANTSTQIRIYMNPNKSPFDDNRVRLALKYLVDREAIVNGVLDGHGTRANDHPIPPFSKWWDDSQTIRQRNVEKAKQLLADAGYPDGFEKDLYVANNLAEALNTAITFQDSVREAGIDISLRTYPRDVYLSKYWTEVDFGVVRWTHRQNPLNFLDLSYKCGVDWNSAHWCNEEVDKLISNLARETNTEKRKKMYAQIQSIISEKGPTIIGAFHDSIAAVSEKIHGFKKATMQGPDDWRYIQTN